MPSIHLTDAQAASFRPLPGRALIRVSPAELMEKGIHLPETAAEAREQALALRRGVIVRVNYRPHPNKELRVRFVIEDKMKLHPLRVVWYLGHADEMDNDYVVVLHGQIVAVEASDAAYPPGWPTP